MEKSFDIEEFIKKYDVHPETITFLKAAAASGERPCHEIGVKAYRELFDKRNKFMAGETEFEGAEFDLNVPSQDVQVKYKTILIIVCMEQCQNERFDHDYNENN